MRYLLIILAFATLSCKTTNKEKSLLIDYEVFYSTLSSIHEYEGDFENPIFRNDSITNDLIADYDSIFSQFNLTKDEFMTEYKTYIAFHSEALDSIYDRMIDDIQAKKDSISEVINKPMEATKPRTKSPNKLKPEIKENLDIQLLEKQKK